MFDTADISPPTPPSGASSPLLPYLNWLSDLELPPQIKNGMMDLHYPESLHHFFLTSERVPVYALWSSDNAAETGIVDATIKSQTEILISILNQYSASSSINLQQSNPDRTNPTIIFIHVTNKSSLEFIPNLATLRQKPNVSFYSFGAHMTINSSQWGFQDIYTEGIKHIILQSAYRCLTIFALSYRWHSHLHSSCAFDRPKRHLETIGMDCNTSPVESVHYTLRARNGGENSLQRPRSNNRLRQV